VKIAQIAPLYESVPPRLYGGTERIVRSEQARMERLPPYGRLSTSTVTTQRKERVHPQSRIDVLRFDSHRHLPLDLS
jgi:hypothetical protein